MGKYIFRTLVLKLKLETAYPAIVFLIATLLAVSSLTGKSIRTTDSVSSLNMTQAVVLTQTIP